LAKVITIQEQLTSLEEKLSSGDYADGAELYQQIDKQIRALSKQEIIDNQQALSAIHTKLLNLAQEINTARDKTRKDLSNFTTNQNKLKAYEIPR
tara:strand:- start:39493 stop:39777 length:285 start_codon:yes stop_codon:yes gene_type:complete